MTAQTILPANTLATGGYEIDNSCRFNGDAYVHKAVVAGNQRTFTYSFWTKRSTLNGYQTFIGYAQSAGGGGSTNRGELIFVGDGDDTLRVGFNPGASSWSNYTMNTGVFRDTSAWYNIVLKLNTTNGTASERLKIFVNGVSQGLDGYPGQNFDTGFNVDGYVYHVGRSASGTGNFLKGYLAEAVFIDGTALDADSFGEFDEDSGIWKPIDVSGLTFGNNGFHLDFEASGNLGNDANGGTDFTEVTLAATDQTTDTCTNNFCTWNPLDTFYNTMTFQEGNTQGTKPNSSVESYGTSTFGMTSGKWYAEFKVISFSGSNSTIGFGIIDRVAVQNDKEIGKHTYGISYKSNGDVFSADGNLLTNQGTLAANDIIGLYIDIDNLKFYFAKNGTIANSGTGLAIPALTSTLNGVYFFGFDNFQAGGSVHQANWGNPAYTGTDKADANGFGSFEYDPSSGTFDSASKDFLALCTKNLAENS